MGLLFCEKKRIGEKWFGLDFVEVRKCTLYTMEVDRREKSV